MSISDLLGKTLISITKNSDDTELVFITNKYEVYRMYHDQNCCEQVYLESIVGDLNDLLSFPILVAEEVTSRENPEGVDYEDDSFTWTFYKLATRRGYVDLRWYGSSNGYYSEAVDFIKLK